jgi:hypothetical protein
MTKRRGDDWDEVFALLTDLSQIGSLEKKVGDRALEEQVARHAGAVKRPRARAARGRT